MTNRRPSSVVRISLAALSAVFLILSFPDFNVGFLAWFALVPLLIAIDGWKPLKAFLVSYLSGIIFFIGTIYWLIHVTLPGMIAVALYLGLYFGIFGLTVSFLLTTNRERRATSYELLFCIPASWVVLEWIRAHFLTGFGWVLLGYSQSYTLPVIQIADTVGVYGVSFIIVLTNAAIFIAISDIKAKKVSVGIISIALLLVFISLAYGVVRLRNIFTGENIKVALIQGNIPQVQKWDARFREEITKRYTDLTEEASAEKPDLIIWPETSVPGFLEGEKDLFDKVGDLARSVNTPLLVGTVSEDKNSDYYNSAALVLPTGEIGGRYDKLHLVPFGEYIPFKKALAFVEKFAPVPIGDCESGSSYTVLSLFIERRSADGGASLKLLKKIRFACLICFEDIFPELSREFIKRGAGFLVNMTNDAWYKRSGANIQHAQASVFRAVENRTNVVRAANTGLSCFIDQKGRITGAVDMYKSGFGVGVITLNRARTFYNVYGDLLVYGCMIFLALRLIKRRV